jgi:signal transduction histidine kinase
VRWGLVHQLFATLLLSALVTGGVLILGGATFLWAEGEKALWQRARGAAQDLAALLADDLLLGDRFSAWERLRAAQARDPDLAYAYVLDPEGRVLVHTLEGGVPEALRALGGERTLSLEGQTVYQTEAEIFGGQIGRLRLGFYQAPLWAEVGQVARTGLFGLLWAVGLGGGLGYFLLLRHLEPLRTMAERVARVGQGEAPVFPEPKNELGLLGRALNGMGQAVAQQRRQLLLLNRLLAEAHALRLEELAERVLSLLTRELGFLCGDLWVEGRVVHCRACQRLCPLGAVGPLAEEALRRGQVVVAPGGVAVPVPPRGALVLHGAPQVEEAWLREFLGALSLPLASALENARLYGLLEEKERQRARLMSAWLAAQEEERGRLARELHDEIGQALTGLLLGLESLPGSEPLKELVRRTLAEVRRLAWDLRPSVLDHLGLKAALERYVREFSERTGIRVDLSFHLLHPLPREWETVIYRVVQEALTNVARHAESPWAAVGVLEAEGEVRVFVEDGGRGFVPEAVEAGRQGLLGMRERVELVGGRFLLESAPGRGTWIQIRLPLEVKA